MRVQTRMAEAFLGKRISPLRVLSEQRRVSKDHLQRKLRTSLKRYCSQEGEKWKTLLKNNDQLIAVADAIWYTLNGKKHTIYLILLRPIADEAAVITPPLLLEGHEDKKGWMEAFNRLPETFRARIIAVVCDGGSGIVHAAQTHRWRIQRCHFHLLAAVQNYLTSGPRSPRRAYALFVLRHAQTFLAGRTLSAERTTLRAIIQSSRSRGLRRVLNGLLEHEFDFHAYLRYPELKLPTTSNAAESAIRCIRDLMSRCRGFRSRAALMLWLIAWTAHQKIIRCRPKYQPN